MIKLDDFPQSMVLNMERKDDNLPCFDTSIIPHPTPIKTEPLLVGKVPNLTEFIMILWVSRK